MCLKNSGSGGFMRLSSINNSYQSLIKVERNTENKAFKGKIQTKVNTSPLSKMDLSEILFFSGSFNPIHNAHVTIAKNIKEKLNCKKVVLVPVYSPYHKSTDLSATFDDKMKMTELAVSDLDDFAVSDIDKRANHGNSYSFNTVRKFIEEFNFNKIGKKMNFLMGADSFAGLDKWYKFQELSKLVKFIVITREGEENPAMSAKRLKKILPDLEYQVFNEFFDVSSTKVRDCILNNKNPEKYLSSNVLGYIKEHNLYV